LLGGRLSHSLYADDLVLFSLATGDEVGTLVEKMEKFEEVSGLKINNDKLVV
jgi:hypothetical protein